MQRSNPVVEKEKHCLMERSLTLHEDSGVGVQCLPKHSILCLQTQQRQIRCYRTNLHQYNDNNFCLESTQTTLHLTDDQDTFPAS